jgi:hypothetical protein
MLVLHPVALLLLWRGTRSTHQPYGTRTP